MTLDNVVPLKLFASDLQDQRNKNVGNILASASSIICGEKIYILTDLS